MLNSFVNNVDCGVNVTLFNDDDILLFDDDNDDDNDDEPVGWVIVDVVFGFSTLLPFISTFYTISDAFANTCCTVFLF